MLPLAHAAPVDLTAINPEAEVVLRAGDLRDVQQARGTLQKVYQPDDEYDTVVGISALFKVVATADFFSAGGPVPSPSLRGVVCGKTGGRTSQRWVSPPAGMGPPVVVSVRW